MLHEIVSFIENPWFYKFNNSGIFEKDTENEFHLSFFNLGMKSFKEFTSRIQKLSKISLNITKDVLEERQHLEKQVEVLQIALKESKDKVNEMKRIINIIKSLKGNLNDFKSFTKKVKALRPFKIPVYYNRLLTIWIICTHTCHVNCNCSN